METLTHLCQSGDKSPVIIIPFRTLTHLDQSGDKQETLTTAFINFAKTKPNEPQYLHGLGVSGTLTDADAAPAFARAKIDLLSSVTHLSLLHGDTGGCWALGVGVCRTGSLGQGVRGGEIREEGMR